MVPNDILRATAERHAARTRERERHAVALAAGSPATADTRDRVEKRMLRLAATAVVGGAAAPKGVAAPPANVFERILGKSDLMSVSFLERAVAASRTVARIRIRSGGRTIGYGTGSLVGPRVLLTNNHVLGSVQDAAESLAEFNYQDGIEAPTVFALDPDALFLTDPALDYTLVAVRERSADDVAVASLGYNRLIEAEGKVLLGEALNIVQHPNGELKQVALRENRLEDILPQFLHYKTDTAPGSSGSPVFNDQWELVALHHSGVPKTDAQGRYLTVDDTVWEPAMGEHRIHWIANEGARVSRIVAHIQQQSLPAAGQALRATLFAQEALVPRPIGTTVPLAPPDSGASDSTASPTFTFFTQAPAFVSVTLGVAAAAGARGSLSTPPPAPPVAVVTPPAPTLPAASADLQQALDAVEAAKAKEYYNEAADTAARAAYYTAIDDGADAGALFAALSGLLGSTHQPQPSYKPSTHVYPFVDLHPDRKLRSLYSQRAFEPEELVREDFRIEAQRAQRLQELLRREQVLTAERIGLEADALEAALPFNCEHVVPQSWYAKDEPMRGDLHHLFACEPGCNSFRGNIPYFDFPDFEEAVRTECGKREGDRFEPGDAKGIVARATLYFLLRYPGTVNGLRATYDAGRLSTLLGWHASHPVTLYERHRNAAIFEKQGNRNPLIDHPQWAGRIDFQQGL